MIERKRCDLNTVTRRRKKKRQKKARTSIWLLHLYMAYSKKIQRKCKRGL